MKKLIIPAAAIVLLATALITSPILGNTLNKLRRNDGSFNSNCCPQCVSPGEPEANSSVIGELPDCCSPDQAGAIAVTAIADSGLGDITEEVEETPIPDCCD